MAPSPNNSLSWSALLLSAALSACGGSQPGADAPAPAEAPSDTAVTSAAEPKAEDEADAGELDLDQLAARFEDAERRLAALNLDDVGLDGPAEGQPDRARPTDDKPKAGAAREAELAKKRPESKADRCSLACRALDSMRRSAAGLCRMVGDDDPRCDSVNERAQKATQSVARACPSCANAEPASQ